MEGSYWDRTRVGRRGFLRLTGVGAAGLAGAALVGCGGGSDAPAPKATAAASGTAAAPAKATPTPAANAQINPSGEVADLLKRFPAVMQHKPGPARKGGTLRIGSPYDLGSLDPQTSTAGVTINHTVIAYNRLMKYDNGPKWDPNDLPGTITNDLAQKFEQPSPTEYVFTLAPNIKFHNVAPVNGRALTAQDVVYSYEKYMAGGAQKYFMQFIDKVTAVDDKTVKITTKRPVADQLAYIASRYLSIFPKELVDSKELATKAIGTGPMILKKALKGERLTWERNPDYFMGPVPLDGIDYVIMSDGTKRDQALRAGQVDLVQSSFNGVESVLELVKSKAAVKGSSAIPVSGRNSIAFQNRSAPWNDVRVRRAVALGSDLKKWGELAYGPGLSFVAPIIPWRMVLNAPPTLGDLGQYYGFNPAEATKLIDAAGVKGHEFPISYYAYNASYDDIADLMVQNMNAIGLKPKTAKTDNNTFNAKWTPGTFEGIALGWKATPVTPTDVISGYYDPASSLNRWGIKDEQISGLVKKQDALSSVDERRAVWKQIWERDIDQVYYVSLPDTLKFNLMSDKVQGFQFGWYQTNLGDTYDIGNQLEDVWLSE